MMTRGFAGRCFVSRRTLSTEAPRRAFAFPCANDWPGSTAVRRRMRQAILRERICQAVPQGGRRRKTGGIATDRRLMVLGRRHSRLERDLAVDLWAPCFAQ